MRTRFYYSLKICAVCILTLVCSLSAFAQDRRITGKVSSGSDAVPGANVVVKGTTTGTTTDANGAFTLNLRGGASVITISAIGYKPLDVTVGNQTVLTISLEEESATLNEVVVTGYSTENRQETTGAVSTVKPAQLKVVPSGNVEQQLQGRVAGITVITNGQPGTSSQIRVRGFGSFGGNQPLYIIDGVPTQTTAFLAPDDIETTTVLKDAASASIYGARAAGGVIIYTTKKGQRRAQKLSVSYDGLFGATDPGSGQKILNPQEQADWTWQARRNDIYQAGGTVGPDSFTGIASGQYGAGQTPVLPDYLLVGNRTGVVGNIDLAAEQAKYNINSANGPVYNVIAANKSGTNWYKEISRVAPLQRHTIGLSGGTETSRFYVSLGAQNQPGVVKNQQYSRYTFRANTEFDILKNLRIGENLQLAYISNPGALGFTGNALGNGTNNNPSTSSDENDVLVAFRQSPIIPVYNVFGGYAGTAAAGFNNPSNPVPNRDAVKNNISQNLYGFGNTYLEYDPIPGLTLRSSIGANYSNSYYNGYGRVQYENSENNTTYTYSEGSNVALAWTLTNTATYRKKFGRHDINLLAGQEALNTGAGRGVSASGINPFTTDPNYVTVSTTTPGATRQAGSYLGLGNKFYSVFGQVRYIYNDKYIVTGVVRRDGSSQFGASNRYGVFPAGSAAWRISSEEFMKSIPWISDLKVRGGYGVMGNSNYLSATNQYSLYASNAGNGYDINGANTSISPGFFRSQIGNPNAKWESSITSNIGIDGAFFNNKLELIFDIWRKDTKDLLFQLPLAGIVGVRANAPYTNVASMRNQGIDITAITRGNIVGGLTYEVTAIGSFLQNQITALAPGVPYVQAGGTRLSTNVVRNAPGQPLSSFYGYKVIGLFNSAADVSGSPTQDGAAPGRFRYADLNGDGKIDDNDRTFLGSPIPKFTGSVTLGLKYKGFDLNTQMYVSLGGKIFNNSRWFTDFYPSFTGAAVSARVKDSWLPTHTNTTIPIFESASNFSTNTQSNSYYVENGSYGRMQYLNVGYTFPAALINRIKFTRLRISASANNLFTITKYTGLDPGVGGSADSNFGIDIGNYPVTRSYNVGLSFGL